MVCSLCPRKCKAERTEYKNDGYCKMPLLPVVARAALHFWEEPCISGENGSGTVFFSGCSLRCVYCQNEIISHKRHGKTISVEQLAKIFKNLEAKGAENINLVNPTHYLLAIKQALDIYKPSVPIVYNSSGYETPEQMELALSFCDVFLLDLKYLSQDRALKYSDSENYPDVATKAILKCYNAIGDNVYNEKGAMQKGLIIRHLVLPMGTNEAIKVMDWVEENTPRAVFSLMSQYTPCGNLEGFKEINRKLTLREHRKVLDYLAGLNIEKVYTQELNSSDNEFIPAFDLTGIDI